MYLKFRNKRISGVLTVLPEREVKFEEEMENYNFPPAKSLKLKMAMGYNKHAIVNEGATVSDMAVKAFNNLFDEKLVEKDDLDALILVTQSPDYFMPPTSNVIQGLLDMKEDMLCMDINQGCAGYIIGLIQAYMLLEQESIKKVALVNADILSLKVSKKDRNSNPLIGDALCVTIVENSEKENTIYCNLKMNGKGAETLMIPAGGFKLPSSAATAEMKEDINGNLRSLDNLVMKGDEVFNFVQLEVPLLIEDALKTANLTVEDIDYYLFHQPNKFMLNKLADRLKVPHEKMPSNIVENFGNASGATIPTNISFNLSDKLTKDKMKVCMSGFGVGLTWGAIIQDLENLNFNKIIRY